MYKKLMKININYYLFTKRYIPGIIKGNIYMLYR